MYREWLLIRDRYPWFGPVVGVAHNEGGQMLGGVSDLLGKEFGYWLR